MQCPGGGGPFPSSKKSQTRYRFMMSAFLVAWATCKLDTGYCSIQVLRVLLSALEL